MMNSRPTKKPEYRGPFYRTRRYIARLVQKRGFLAAASFLIAITFWSVLVASDNTLTRPKTFPAVAVSVTGEGGLKSRGYIVTDDIEEMVPSVRMTVEVTQANYSRVSGTSYNPHYDLSQIKGEGKNVLTLAFSSQLYGPVTSCDPQTITVNVERYITRRVPVVLEITGEIGEGLYLDSYKTDPMSLSVSGPQSLVTSVARVVAKLDQTSLSAARMSDRSALSIELQNAAGEVISSDKIEITNQSVITGAVAVETELVPVKQVPLDAQSFVTGEPAEGYRVTNVELSQNAFSVAAQQSILDGIAMILADQSLNIEGADQDVSGYVRVKRPAGIENALPTEVMVTAHIEEEDFERTIKRVAIETEGLPDAYSAALSQNATTLLLSGKYGFVSGVGAEDIRLFVDLSDLTPGQYDVPVQVHIDNAEAFSCALSVPQVSVVIREK